MLRRSRSVFVHAEQKGRIVVEKILDGSNAALGGLQLGDVIRGTTGRSKVQIWAVTMRVCCDRLSQCQQPAHQAYTQGRSELRRHVCCMTTFLAVLKTSKHL